VKPFGAAGRQRRGTAGFTLVEVILALAILGIGITVLVATTSKCLAVARKARDYETARRLLGVLEATHPLALEEEIEEGSEEGVFDPPNERFHWRRTITAVEDLPVLESEELSDQEPDFFLVRVRIWWAEHGRNSFEEVEDYVYAPPKKEGGSFERRGR